MAERDQPDIDRVREALREHDERREQEDRPAETPVPEEPPPEDDGDDG